MRFTLRRSLERFPLVRFLSGVLSPRIRAGIRAGLVSAAATAGAIVGFGVRHDDWSGPFVSLGRQAMQGFGLGSLPAFLASAAGIAVHAAWMVLWGIVFAAMSHRRSLAVATALAIVVGAAAALTARSVIPAALGAIRFAALPGTQAVLCVALLTLGLVTGRALAGADNVEG
jgi:hypothetical protein